MKRTKTSDRLIIMGGVVRFLMTLQTRRSLTVTEGILFPWEGRDMLKSNINLGNFFNFQIIILMKLIRTICILRFFRELYKK